MEKTGLINKIATKLDINWQAQIKLEASTVMQERNKSLSETLSLLKSVKTNKDITLALGIEEMMLRQELATYINSSEQYNSVFGAINQLQDAKKSLKVIHNHEVYKSATDTYSGKNKEAGLPLDSFRQFLKSHSARFTNSMKSMLSVPEKNILRQRQENLSMIKDVYMDMQRQALGLTAQEK